MSTSTSGLAKYDGGNLTAIANPDATASGVAGQFSVFNNDLYFRYQNSTGKMVLGKFDGTTITTFPNPDNGSGLNGLGKPIVCNSNLNYQYQNAAGKGLIVKFDGTTETAQVRRSIDGGATFTSSTNLPGGNVQLVRISPHDNIFINGPAPFGMPPLYYSDSANNGTTFTQSAHFPINKSITDIAFDNRDSMYVGTQNGLYTTSLPFNPASSIFSLNASNGPQSVTSFAKDECRFLYTTTYFAGISKSTIPVDVTNVCNILPVSFLDFSGNYDKSSDLVKLKWSVTNEINIHHYKIEKSAEGSNFKILDTINVKAFSGLSNNYSLDDFVAFNGKNFYQISEITNDGVTTYYNTIIVTKPVSLTQSLLLFSNLVINIVNPSFQNLQGRS